MPSSCQQCGTNLKLAPSGRRKRFCSNACRQAAFRNETTAKRASSHPTKGHEKPALEPIETQYDFPLRNEELEPSLSSAHFSNELTFQKLNSVTWKLTDGVQINTGSGRASRALGYVMEVLPGRWMARVRSLGSGLLSFGAAKQEAIRLYGCGEKGTIGLDSPAELAGCSRDKQNGPSKRETKSTCRFDWGRAERSHRSEN